MKNPVFSGLALLVALMISAGASASVITYDLTNKAPGAQNPPDYGLRLDKLFGSVDAPWTFDFNENSGADVTMAIDTTNAVVTIAGTVIGGKDIGTAWDAATVATWDLFFKYDTGVTIDNATTGEFTVDGTSDEWNFGFMQLQTDIDLDGDSVSDIGRYIGLADYHGGFLDFGTHPDFQGWLKDTAGFVDDISDLTSLSYDRDGACCLDFGANAHPVPAPAPIGLILLGLVGILTPGIRRFLNR